MIKETYGAQGRTEQAMDKYAKARGISIAVALTHEIVKEYGRYLKWVNT